MWLLLKYTLLYASVLALVALGGMFSERSGVINIALEGIMVVGGLMGVVMINILNAAGVPVFLGILLAILMAGVAGMLYSSLLAFSAVNLKADQTIGGTALNLLATALAVVVAKRINGTDGMRLMACGEHPQAADSVGINVYKMRWAGVLISGALGGIGGMAYIVPAVGDWNFEMGVAGMGFLALAVMIFGQWKPMGIAAAAVFFAVFRAMANIFDSIAFLNALNWPKEIYNMMPFIASMIVLAFTSKKSKAPKAEGIPYDKGSR